MTDPLPQTPAAKRRTLTGSLRASFLTGLVVVLPVGLTIYLTWAVIGWIDAWILPLIPASYQPQVLVNYYVGPDAHVPVRGVGVVVFLIFTIAVGWVAKGIIGRSTIAWAESLVDRMPVVRSVYAGIKQIAETFFAKSEKSFDRCCLVEFPREGYWAVGMVASAPKGEIASKLPQKDGMVAVFLGLTPLTSGLIIFVPERDVIPLEMKADDAVKLIVSAGLVYPVPKDQIQAAIAAR
jgi:uncharacterized membrane protein